MEPFVSTNTKSEKKGKVHDKYQDAFLKTNKSTYSTHQQTVHLITNVEFTQTSCLKETRQYHSTIPLVAAITQSNKVFI